MASELQKQISPNFTAALLNDILQKETRLTNVQITKIKFGEPQKKGDSYLSTVIRFVVEGVGKDETSGNDVNFSVPIITKGLPKNIGRRKTFRSTDFFRNETIFFNKVWPALRAFQDSKTTTNGFVQIPKCFAAIADGENDFIALEDLSFQGYQTAVRQNGLDLAHTKLILGVFAQFHALSLAFKDQQPQQFEEIANSLEETYFAESVRKWYETFQKTLFVVIRDAVQKHLAEDYLEKFDAFIGGDVYGEIVRLCKEHGTYAVITHGDAWIPNFLPKYMENTQTPIAAMMIDFQLARYASLALDITFFIYACTDKPLRDAHWDEMILGYHQEFVKVLERLGSSPNLLTLEALEADIKKYVPFGITMSMESITMSLLDDNDISDFDVIEGDQEVPIESVWIIRPFKSAEKSQRIANFIQDVVDRKFM